MRIDIMPLTPNVLAQLAGVYLIADDAEDVGKFDRLHHWHIGALLLLASSVQLVEGG